MKVVIIIFVILILAGLVIYNLLINRKNKVLRSKSNIDVYLIQRFNLIPNLVKCVKEYTNYERSVLEDLVSIRMQYMNDKNMQIANILNTKINQVIIQVENYPELKASEQYILLEKNLVKMENQIQAARRIYNLSVLKYNNLVTSFPSNLVAKIFKFRTEDFFEGDSDSRNSIKIEESNGKIYEKNSENNY